MSKDSSATIVSNVDVCTYRHINNILEDEGDEKETKVVSSVDVEVRLTDCNRGIAWHCFGSTEKEAVSRIDKTIKAFELLKEDIHKAYEVKAKEESKNDKRRRSDKR
jgi:hypothetical protein